MQHDRRQFQRLRLSKPILARMDEENALILDVGMAGAFIEHYGAVQPGHLFRLAFQWQGEEIAYRCEIVRTTVVREPAGDGKSALSHSGAHFLEPIGASAARLEEMITVYVGRLLAAQRANAAGREDDTAGATILAGLGGARRKRTRGYITHRLRDNSWWRVPTDSPLQPQDGFTVGAWEDDEEVATLCRTYEEADEEGRRMIRLVAELSVMHRP